MSTFRETQKRSLVKSVSFRIIVIVSDLVVIFVITHRYDITIGVTLFTNLASMVLYYLHERLWNNISFGRKSEKDKKT